MTTAYRLTPWTDVVRPHPDIERGELDISHYAADLGGVDAADPNVPRIYREAEEFFRTTYMTRNLKRLLADVMMVVGGGKGDRVIQLRTPFGGGKTHSLVALYHLMKHRADIDPRLLEGIPDPGAGKVVVLSGIKLDPYKPRVVEGLAVHTLWGELAYRIGGPPAYEEVRVHDEEGAAPGGDTLRDLIGGRPTLILLDEVLVYVESAGGATGENPRRRQALVFLQKLTEVVRNLPNAAMVYSLQASTHEAAGDEALLTELEKLVTRVDAKREPVSDDELTRVVQRRLFPDFGSRPEHAEIASRVAREYGVAYRRVREAYSQTSADKRSAGVEAEQFEQRVRESYPFHPELLDLMYHRWGSLPSYQRTRGALQFLARVVHALWHGARTSQPLIGPGDAPLEDDLVRGAFFSQVGQPREQYTSVLSADVVGPQARAHIVDERLSADSPRYKELRIGTRAATAVMLYSFGAREPEEPGVVEADLMQALTTPDIDRNVLASALSDLREQLLYLHYSGRRYRFEPKPNLNLLLAEEMKKVGADEVRSRLHKQVSSLLRSAGQGALVWPEDSAAVPDHEPWFRLVYLPPEDSSGDDETLRRRVSDMVDNAGARRRDFKNAIAFAVPGSAALDRCRQAARALIGLEALDDDVKASRVIVQPEQREDLAQRRRSTSAELEASADALYQILLVPVPDREGDHPFLLEVVDLRAQLTAGRDLHTRMLDGLRKYVFDSVTPARLATLTKLGIKHEWVACADLPSWFFTYLDFPKLLSTEALRAAVAAGTADVFGYVASATLEDAVPVPSRPDLVRFGERIPVDEVDLGSGCYLLVPELALHLRGPVGAAADGASNRKSDETTAVVSPVPGTGAEPPATPTPADTTTYRLRAELDAAQLFRILPAVQNLADRSTRLRVLFDLEAEATEGFSRTWLRNAVLEHLEEAGVVPLK
jgi:hypothetical protein